jgi:flagellar assembly protein FliH
LDLLLDRERLVARIHPSDLDAMRRHKPDLLKDFDGIRRIEFQPDEAMTPGGCVVESELLCADARIETQLDAMLAALRSAPESPAQ